MDYITHKIPLLINGIFFVIFKMVGEYMKYNRILLKLSGEALKNDKDGIIDFEYVLKLCSEIKKIRDLGIEIAIVVGGGNIWRGRNNTYINSDVSDKIGILSTTINSFIIDEAFKKLKTNSIVLNSLEIEGIINKVSEEELKTLIKNNILIFGGGTGEVGFSTDTAAAIYAKEMDADVIIKLTNVDGVYDKDPKISEDAKLYKNISYQEVLDKNIKVMDKTSIEISMKNQIPIIVTNIKTLNKLDEFLCGKLEGSLISL